MKKELLKAVNPVFTTAKGCLGLLSKTGVKDAAELVSLIDMDGMSKKTDPLLRSRCN